MFKNKTEKILFRIVEYGIYLSLFSPLVVLNNYLFPFVSPKTFFFRIIVDITFIAYIFLATLNSKYQPRITPLTLAITLFLGIVFLTSLTGASFAKSFWSIFERMTGILTLLHLFIFYIILTSCFQEKKYWERFFLVSISVAVIISLIAFHKVRGDGTKSHLEQILDYIIIAGRGGSTLGNSSFLMSYLIFNIFFAGILIIIKKQAIWRLSILSALILFLILLFFNPEKITKGAVSSFLIGITFFVTLMLFFSKNKFLKRSSLLFFILMTIIGVFIVKNFYFKDRPFNLLEIPDPSRQIVWKIGWQSWQERFWFGWGWENFDIPFAKYYNPSLPATGDMWYDKVHNIVLDVAVSSGIIGLLIYFSIFGVAIFGLYKLLKKEYLKDDFFVSLSLITLFLVYFLQNIWVFDMISSYIMFFGTLAFVYFLIYSQKEKEESKNITFSSFIGILLIFATLFIFFYDNVQPARAAKEIAKGFVFIEEGKFNIEKSISSFQKTLSLSPMSYFEAPPLFYRTLNKLVFYAGKENVNLIIKAINDLEEALKKSLKNNPDNVRTMIVLADYYNFLYSVAQEEKFSLLAEDLLQKAIKINPMNQQLYWILSQTKVNQGKTEEAIFLAEKALSMEPKLFDSHRILITLYLFKGDKEMAFKKLEDALKINPQWKDNLTKLIESAKFQ